LVLVVEQPSDVASFESTGMYRGVYHVLMGRLTPLEGVGPGELNIDRLLDRVREGEVREVILGTNPTLEGDGTAMYLADRLRELGAKVTRLARGLPTGSNLGGVSKAVLADAIHGRHAMEEGE
ncbi:MAG: toprim domain-containing protein, partial [Phycisphaeraceae bacterium]